MSATAENVSPINSPSTVPGVYQAIAGVMGDIAKTGIAKDQKNEQQRFAFRGIDGTRNALSPLLVRHGLLILPRVEARRQWDKLTKSGSPITHTELTVEYELIGVADGSSYKVRVISEALDQSDKSCSKALSMAYKTMAFDVFCIPVEGEDPDATTHELSATMPDSALETLRQRVTDHGGDAEAWTAAMAGKYPDGIPMAHYDGLAQQIDRTAEKRRAAEASG